MRSSAREVALLIHQYYLENPSGGNCHIVLDDKNVETNSLEFCMKECQKNNDDDGLIIMIAMKQMRRTARLKAIYLSRSFEK